MPGVGGRAWVRRPFAGGVDIGDIFGDLFGEMFNVGGGRQRARAQQRGDDLRFDLAIDFEDAIFRHRDRSEDSPPGDLRGLPGQRQRIGRGPSVCPQCQGRGHRSATSRDSSPWRAPAAPAAARVR